MRIVKWVLGIVLLLAAVLVGGGLLLSPAYTVTRSATIAAPPERVYPLVADPRGWQRWSAWNRRDPAMRITYSGPASGAGAAWEWHSVSEGDGKMTFTAAEAPRRVAFDLYFPDMEATSRGEMRFEPDAGGTRVTWTMNGDMGRNPVWRWMGLAMDGMVGKDFEAGLANLKAIAEGK